MARPWIPGGVTAAFIPCDVCFVFVFVCVVVCVRVRLLAVLDHPLTLTSRS